VPKARAGVEAAPVLANCKGLLLATVGAGDVRVGADAATTGARIAWTGTDVRSQFRFGQFRSAAVEIANSPTLVVPTVRALMFSTALTE
jgi:hypothetical protein